MSRRLTKKPAQAPTPPKKLRSGNSGDGRKETGERKKGEGRQEIIFEKFSAYKLAGEIINF